MTRLVCAFILCLGSGCGDPALRSDLTDLKKQLEEVQRRAQRAEQKAETLEDRVFLLTDRMESAQVASVRPATSAPPKLPVVRLKPPAAEGEEGAEQIEYEGDARSPTPERTRPIFLSGHESQKPMTTPAPKREKAPPAPLHAPAQGDSLGVAPAPPITKGGAPEGDPARAYKEAYDLLRGGQHDAAAGKLREFVRRFPKHEYADNAQYWLGETFYDRKRYAEAAVEFKSAVERFPLGNKAPDALLKLGYCLVAMGDTKKGRAVLETVPETYPRTEAARLAGERLVELGTHKPEGNP
jgi:tol-pal system protein YbgF